MTRCMSWMVSGMLTLVVGMPALAQQGAPARRVADDATLFSKDAEAKADASIAKIKSRFHKDLVIETVESVESPPLGLDKKNDAYFDKWAADRFRRLAMDGIYIGIIKQPRKLRIHVGQHTLEHLFTRADEANLEKLMLSELKKAKTSSDFDQVLLDSVRFVGETMEKNAPKTAQTSPTNKPESRPEPRPGPDANERGGADAVGGMPDWTRYLCIGAAVIAVIWVVLAVIRAIGSRASAGQGMGGGPMGGQGGGGGGGFMSSMLGGLFGAAAGMWMYNNMFGGQAHAGGYQQPMSGGSPPSGEGPSDVGAGPGSTAGGDWGTPGETPGGDTGGGGGGDWGGGGGDTGGDTGGGGGDWGGGGGGGDTGGGGDWGGGGGGGDGGGGGGDW